MEKILHYKTPGWEIEYDFHRQEESELRGGKARNLIKSSFILKYIGKKEQLDCFEIKRLSYEQTNQKGLYGWVNDFHFITDHLLLGVSSQDRVEIVFNRSDIHNQLKKKHWNEIRKKHKGEDNCEAMLEQVDHLLQDDLLFAESLCYAPPFSMLFNGMHSQLFKDNQANERIARISGFGGVQYLPLILDDKLSLPKKDDTNYFEVKSEGKIDKEEFDEQKFNRFVRELSNEPTAVCELQTRHTERYRLDEHHRITNAMCLHHSVVPYFMVRKDYSLLKASSI